MASRTLPPIKIVNVDQSEQFASVIGEAFAGDALGRANILSRDGLPNDAKIPIERRIKQFLPLIQSKASDGAILVEAGDWAAVALWIPPTVKSPPPDYSTMPAPLVQYIQRFSEVKKRHLRDRDYWYLNFIGRHPRRKDSGVIRALFEPYLLRARQEGLPVWLEATTPHARDVYSYFGFKVAEEVVIGEGSIDDNGNLVSGGKGLLIYGMIVEP